MIRVLHFADLHLGVENYGRLDPETGLSSRLMDFLRAFDFVVDYAIDQEIDLVLFAGDAFKNRDPSPTHQREFARRIRRLSAANVPTFLLVGNHDLPNAVKRAHAVEIFNTLGTPNITVAERPCYERIETKNGVVQVVALPWVTRSHLLTREEYQGLSLDEVNEKIAAVLSRVMAAQVARVNDDEPAVLVAHGSAPGAVFGTERSVLLGQDVLLDLSLLRDPRFDYVALGHIHKHQALYDDPPIVYSGSIERIDFGEAREPKGFVVAEIGDGPTRWEFVETPTRAFREIVLDVRTDSDPMPRIRERLGEIDLAGAVVKVVIKATVDNEAHLDAREVRRMLSDASHVAAIVRDVERPTRLRLGTAQDISEAGPRELLERYLEAKQTPAERRQTLLHYADLILAAKAEE